MKPLFHPQLVNGNCGDPALYIDFLFQKRALLFDLGDLHQLTPRKILRLSHIFVSHTHMDHFIGFDRILRICLGRQRRLQLFGPPGLVRQVENKLGAYTWNLVHTYAHDFAIVASEIHPDDTVQSACFHSRTGFRRQNGGTVQAVDKVLLDEASFQIHCTTLDHRTPSLAFALREKHHINIWKNRLEDMKLPTGPWLNTLKMAVLTDQGDDYQVRIPHVQSGQGPDRMLPLGLLKKNILRIVPGQKIAYITDAVFHESNLQRMIRLAKGADYLFIEACFTSADSHLAKAKYHLTARQAGLVAQLADTGQVIPFHFSARYRSEKQLRIEVERSFRAPLIAAGSHTAPADPDYKVAISALSKRR